MMINQNVQPSLGKIKKSDPKVGKVGFTINKKKDYLHFWNSLSPGDRD